MTETQTILVQAVVSATERPAVEKAVGLLATSLNAVSKTPWKVDCTFPQSLEAIQRSAETELIVTSLLDEVERFEEPWGETEARLRSRYEALLDTGGLEVFVCTVLRHVDGDVTSDAAARRVRIRRLNLLAAELSREMGLLVIDIDRDLADVGARALETDYRLMGPYAPEAAGKSMTMALLLVGLDAFVRVEVQDAARQVARAHQLECATQPVAAPKMEFRHAIATRLGRRDQFVEPPIDSVDENNVASYIQRVLKRQISLRDAASIAIQLIRSQGFRPTVARLASGLRILATKN